jgi:hypothetical protein
MVGDKPVERNDDYPDEEDGDGYQMLAQATKQIAIALITTCASAG